MDGARAGRGGRRARRWLRRSRHDVSAAPSLAPPPAGSVDDRAKIRRLEPDATLPDLEPDEDVREIPSALDGIRPVAHGILDEVVEVERQREHRLRRHVGNARARAVLPDPDIPGAGNARDGDVRE